MTTESKFFALLDHLNRGGSYNFWAVETRESDGAISRRSHWWKAGDPAPIPRPENGDVYFGVHPCDSIPETNASGNETEEQYVRSQVERLEFASCLYSEFDAKDYGSKGAIYDHLKTLPLFPSIVIDSGGGYHCYWLLRSKIDLRMMRNIFKQIQHAWVLFVGGDAGAKNLNRVLRVPGTKNCKPQYAPSYPTVEFVHFDMECLYSLVEVQKVIPKAFQEKAERSDRPVESTYTPTTSKAEEADAFLKMLDSSRCGSYDDWVRVGMALYEVPGGYSLWDQWSRGSEKYDERIMERKWKTFRGGGVSFSTLAYMAKEDSPAEFEEFQRSQKESARQNARERSGSAQKKQHQDTVNIVQQSLAEVGVQEWEDDVNFLTADDEGNAEAVRLFFGDRFCHTESYGWMHHNGKCWSRDLAEPALHQAILRSLKNRKKAAEEIDDENIRKAVREKTKGSAANVRNAKFIFESMVSRHVGEFDQEHDFLNVKNGCIDLRTGELLPHSTKQTFTYCLGVEYKPSVDYTEWEKFLSSVVEAPEMVEYLQRCIGYSLTGHVSEEVLWYIQGPSRSGKGTFTETIQKLMGLPLCAEVQFGTFTRDRDNDANNFDLAPLKPCRLLFASESRKNQRLNAPAVKWLTGGNQVRCSFKKKDHFEYRPQYKIWLTSNHPVNADVDDDAVWGRLRYLRFPHSHLGEEDKGLKERMKSPENLERVLTWAVQGAKRWYETRGQGMLTPDIVTASTKQIREDQDFVKQWIDECLDREAGEHKFLVNSVIYASYAKWCEENAVTPKKKASFTQALNAKGITGPTSKKVDGKTHRVWMGLQLADSVEENSNGFF